MKGKCDELIHQIQGMGIGAAECLACLQKTFISHSLEAARECRDKIAVMRAKEREIVKNVERSERPSAEKEELKEVCRLFLEICGYLEAMADTLQKKAREHILFSNRAVTEISFLSQTLADVLRATADLVVVKNPVLMRYVKESEAMVAKVSREYATHHEERLIEGLCLPVASPIFLKLLDEFNGMARKAKEIAERMSAQKSGPEP